MKWLIYGGKGWIGSYIVQQLELFGETIILGQCRTDSNDLEKEIIKISPDRVICVIGRTSGPGYSNIDYLEQKGKLVENVKDNLFGPISLAFITNKYNIHMTYFGTGCIYSGYAEETDGYLETDNPDFFGSSYSVVKGYTDRIMKNFDNVLNVRIRMPIMDDKNPKNFIMKLLSYKKICSIPNSMSVLPELVPIMIDMAFNKLVGPINMVNPGTITHNEILEMVREYKIPELHWENFSLEEQSQVLVAERSNNKLNTEKLESLYKVKNIKDSTREIIQKINF